MNAMIANNSKNWFIDDQKLNLKNPVYELQSDLQFYFRSNLQFIEIPRASYICIFIDKLLLKCFGHKSLCKHFDLPKDTRTVSSPSWQTGIFSSVRENSEFLAEWIRGERMPERSMRYSFAVTNVGEQNCTRLHPSQMHFVRAGNENAIASRPKRRIAQGDDTFGERKPIFVRVLSVEGWTARDFRRWARSIFRERWLSADGKRRRRLRRGALKNATSERLPPGEVHSSSMSLFPLSGVGAIRRRISTKVQFRTTFVN